MIQTKLGHIQLNVYQHNLPFYKELFAFMGWRILEDDSMTLGVGEDIFSSLWFVGEAVDADNDYDGPGMNHLGLLVQSQDEVDQMVSYLQQRNIAPLFETPRHRPEFSKDTEHTYYQVMFESPDRILFEVVYMGRLAQ
ncbi:MAG: hypothetical protein CL608_08670 [Anaerolineaceae bacterium]|nr:hypothetical protein [Anaerolineaceae bacterium]